MLPKAGFKLTLSPLTDSGPNRRPCWVPNVSCARRFAHAFAIIGWDLSGSAAGGSAITAVMKGDHSYWTFEDMQAAVQLLWAAPMAWLSMMGMASEAVPSHCRRHVGDVQKQRKSSFRR